MDIISIVLLEGALEYKESLDLQKKLLNLRQKDLINDFLLVLEHPPIITLGKSANASHILFSNETLKVLGVKVYQSDRGGDVTYHGPGQIVGYPIMDIRKNNISIKKYIWMLEQMFIELLKNEYFIPAYREAQNRGVWVNDQKITAIGCAVKSGVTTHGFAFNVSTNLKHFELINPCGIIDKGVTSLEAVLGDPIDFNQVKQIVVDYFCQTFNKQPKFVTGVKLKQMIGVVDIA